MCYLCGDPHYNTFDGLMLHYQGICLYNLATPAEEYPDMPYFRIHAKSERRFGQNNVAYPRYVEVEVFGHTVRLDKGKLVYVSDSSDVIYCKLEGARASTGLSLLCVDV